MMNLLMKIIKKHENSEVDWKEGATGNRSIRIQEEDFKKFGKSELIAEAKALEEAKLITVKWMNSKSDMEKICYSLDQVTEIYKLLAMEPKQERIKRKLQWLEEWKSSITSNWILQYADELLDGLKNGKEPLDLENSLLFSCLYEMDQLTYPVFKHVFSAKFLKDSKVFENQLETKVVSIARKYHMEVDEDMDKSEILSQLYIEEYNAELCIKGDLSIQIDSEIVDLSSFKYGVSLNSETLKHLSFFDIQRIKKVITVENKANYMSMPYEAHTLIIFCHGYFTPLERVVLQKLYEILQGTPVEYYHTGDLDYGGICIFRYIKSKIFPDLKPDQMDVAQFERYRSSGYIIQEETLEKLQRLIDREEPELKCLQELMECIRKEKLGIEQEMFLLRDL